METTRIERSRRDAALSSGQRRIAPGSIRVAYLLSRYPAVSHTFFLQEVAGLRARGLHIETASINPPDRPLHQLPQAEAEEARTTLVLKDGKLLASAGKLIATVLAHPITFLRGLGAVASVPNLTLRRRAFWLFYLAEAMLLGRWMKKRNIRQLHVHFGGAVASVGMLASKAWRLPTRSRSTGRRNF
jgi:hypothetical protein